MQRPACRFASLTWPISALVLVGQLVCRRQGRLS